MADRQVDHLLIGAGVASANCARHLRENSDDSILIVGREPEPPYNRPELTKGYLARTVDREMDYFRPAGFWQEQDIELITRMNVVALDADAREAKLMSGETIAFGNALLATGANVNLLHVEGMGQEGIHYLRAFGNSDSILEDVEALGQRVTMIGGSYIGCEVAATLAAQGCDCRIVMLEELPLQRTLGDVFGHWTMDRLTGMGVEFHPAEGLARFDGDGERVSAVICESGLEVETDLVVIGAGVHPETTLARQAGLEFGERGGVVTDAGLRASKQGIFAAGDVAEWFSPSHQQHIRVEHWDVAFNHGRTAALNMLGGNVEHDVVPYFWSDLADLEIESVGPAYGWDREIVRGDAKSDSFSVWYMQGDRVAQAAAVGRSDELEVAKVLIRERRSLSDDRLELLSDDGADLSALG